MTCLPVAQHCPQPVRCSALRRCGTFHFSWIQSHLRVHSLHSSGTNVLTSSHRLLFSWSRLQPFSFAVGFHLCRQRQQPAIHQLGLVIQWGHRSRAVAAVQAQGSTNGTIARFDLGLSWLAAQELKTPRCARCLGAQHQRLQTSVWVSIPPHAWRPGGTVCVCCIQSTSLPRDPWRVSPLYKPCAA